MQCQKMLEEGNRFPLGLGNPICVLGMEPGLNVLNCCPSLQPVIYFIKHDDDYDSDDDDDGVILCLGTYVWILEDNLRNGFSSATVSCRDGI